MYLCNNAALDIHYPNNINFKATFKSFGNGQLTLKKSKNSELMSIDMANVVFMETHFLRQTRQLVARYYYTGPMPWLTEQAKSAEHWDVILSSVKV
jgi:predicted SnoaL-like aldol condensation-catalyzing enzyme